MYYINLNIRFQKGIDGTGMEKDKNNRNRIVSVWFILPIICDTNADIVIYPQNV